MNRWFIIPFTLIILNNYVYAQVTISEIKKSDDTVFLKPEPYDSLKNFKQQERNIDYTQYIGLQFYLPPSMGNDGVFGEYPFVFSKTLTALKMDTAMFSPSNFQKQNSRIYTFQTPGLAQYVTIYTFVYKPFIYNYTFRPYHSTRFDLSDLEVNVSNSRDIGDKYYTLSAVLYGDTLNKFWGERHTALQRKRNNGSGYFTDANDFRRDQNLPQQIFLLKDNVTNDSLYCIYMDSFVLVPYFVKQKLLYENKSLICLRQFEGKDIKTDKDVIIGKLSKWLCRQVTLLKNKGNTINYILTNDLGETISVYYIDDNFIDAQAYDKAEREKKLNEAELLRRKNQQETAEKKNKEIAKNKYIAICIDKFGQTNGSLIAQGKIKIGMTAEMCLESWKKPYGKNKTITEDGYTETWFYTGAELYFYNGLLKQINRYN